MFLELLVIGLGVLISFFLKETSFLAINYIYPDFLVIYVIFFALRRGEFSGLWIGFFAGLLEDSAIRFFSESQHAFVPVIGTHMFFYTLTGYLIGKFKRIIDRHSLLPIVVVVFLSTTIVGFCVWLLTGVLQDFNKNQSILATALYTALLSPVWFWLLGWLFRHSAEEAD